MAVSDGCNLCGAVEFAEAADRHKIRPIFASELWTVDGDPGEDGRRPGCQVVAVVRTQEGWENLCRLLTIGHRQRNFSPRVTVAQIGEHSAGLHFLTGNRYGVFHDPDLARRRLDELVEAVGGRVDVEVVDHGTDEDGPRNDLAVSLAKELRLRICATNDVRYLEPKDAPVLEAMISIGTGDPELSRDSCHTDQAWLKTRSEMEEIFPAEWLDRSVEIADSCEFVLRRGKPMLPRVELSEPAHSVMARFPAPADFPSPPVAEISADPKPADAWFRWLCRTGLDLRLSSQPHALDFATRDEYFAQLDFEISVISGMDYVVYHLIVAEFTNWAKDAGIAVGPGRGSAAGSIAVWALRITDINPRQFGLFFERFLNPERRGLPDIDMDFEQGRREEVIRHVRDRYGEECVGQILTIFKLKPRSAVKDAARFCKVRFDTANRWAS